MNAEATIGRASHGASPIADSESLTAHLAEFVVDYDVATADQDVRDAAKALILDGIGVMVAGARNPLASTLLKYADAFGGREQCTLLGRSHRTDPLMATFVHGSMLHADDFEIQGLVPVHGTSVLLPPALAVAELRGLEGIDVLAAIIVGWEVQSRLRISGPLLDFGGFHPVGVFGPIGAAVSSGKILGLSRDEMRSAFGIAASRTGGLLGNNGTMVKSTHPGNAGRMGLEAAMLASLGFEGNPNIFDVPRGFVSTLLKGEFDESKVRNGLEEARFLVSPGYTIKAYPAEIYMMRVIESVATLKAIHHLQPDDVEHLDIEMQHVRPDLSRPRPAGGLDGKFSYEYCAAVALAEEHVELRSFSDEVRFSPVIESLLPRITPVGPPASHPDPLYATWVIARARLRNGSVVEYKCEQFKGSIPNPLTREERLLKFRGCTRDSWSATDVESTIDAIENIEQPGQVARIIELLGRTAETGR